MFFFVFFTEQMKAGRWLGLRSSKCELCCGHVVQQHREPFKHFPLCLLCFTNTPNDVT